MGVYTRTRLGKQETVHYQPKKKWLVTHADGSVTPVVAVSRYDAAQQMKQGGHKPAIKIDEVKPWIQASAYEEVRKAGDATCPYDGQNGVQLRRFKQGAFWIREFRCPKGHIWQRTQ